MSILGFSNKVTFLDTLGLSHVHLLSSWHLRWGFFVTSWKHTAFNVSCSASPSEQAFWRGSWWMYSGVTCAPLGFPILL